jgi:uncharacterized SAM-binding protein YcdF (DUF218 family)
MDILKSIWQFTASPSGIIALCFVVSLPLIAMGKRVGKYLLVLGIVFFLVFSSSPLSIALLARLENTYPPLLDTKELGSIDTIVLLTTAAWGDTDVPVTSQVGETTQSRLMEAIRLYQLIPGAKIVISGGPLDPGGSSPAVCGIVGDLANALGIPKGRIVLEPNSTTTYENGVEVKKILGEKRFILVTSASHLPRAVAVFRKLGMSPVPAPADIRSIQHRPHFDASGGRLLKEIVSALPSSTHLVHSERALHEYVGFAWYWLRGWI